MNIKKKLMVLLAAGIVAISASPLVLAATPEPAGNAAQTQTADQTQQAQSVPVTTQTNSAGFENGRYLTKGGAAFWFVLIFVLNGALSFWIGNRFYRLSRKDNHLSGEIRALRKDIEEKFVNSVGGFSEQEIDIENLNESLAMTDEGIKPAERQPVFREVSAEEEERFRKWEEAQSRPHTERARKPQTKAKSAVSEELEDDFEEIRRIKRKNYQPKRENADTFDLDEDNSDEELGETKEIKIKGENVKNRAKEILGDIFPFKED